MTSRVYILSDSRGHPVMATPALAGSIGELGKAGKHFHAVMNRDEFIKANVFAQAELKSGQTDGIKVCRAIKFPQNLPPADEYVFVRQGRDAVTESAVNNRMMRTVELMSELTAIKNELSKTDENFETARFDMAKTVTGWKESRETLVIDYAGDFLFATKDSALGYYVVPAKKGKSGWLVFDVWKDHMHYLAIPFEEANQELKRA